MYVCYLRYTNFRMVAVAVSPLSLEIYRLLSRSKAIPSGWLNNAGSSAYAAFTCQAGSVITSNLFTEERINHSLVPGHFASADGLKDAFFCFFARLIPAVFNW